ncbi:hypothetical protein KL866_00785 [Alteromonas sp. ALT199]|uniref:hypothetical protein n=1 Tax=unclassified Alteromonas TaxID=2614992 RepID=UPI001BEA60C7|nr:hypothetical protein [Alteromonas sp. ALT199]MBT3133672.1 hypothetical protein [Alteromonas sp. ALT199]
MPENEKSSFKHGIIVALIGAIFGALVTIVGQPYVNQVFEEAKTPRLVKEYHQTNVRGLPDNVRKQITLITSRYNIRHVGGGPAEEITVSIHSDKDISASSIVIDPSSETATVKDVNGKFKKIEIPAIRPKGQVSFEITHSPSNQIQLEEISKSGEIVDSEFAARSSRNGWWEYFIVGLILTVILGILIVIYISLKKGADYLVGMESGTSDNIDAEKKTKIASILVLVITYNFISYFGLGGLSLPRIPIQDAFYALLMYVIVTNYKRILIIIEKALYK